MGTIHLMFIQHTWYLDINAPLLQFTGIVDATPLNYATHVENSAVLNDNNNNNNNIIIIIINDNNNSNYN